MTARAHPISARRFLSQGTEPARRNPTVLALGALAAGSLGTLALLKLRAAPDRAPLAVAHSDSGSPPNLNSLASSDHVDYPPAVTAEDVTRALNRGAASYHVGQKLGQVQQYDVAQVASNGPCEDAYVHGSFSNPLRAGGPADWMAWAVFDGHCGWQTSALLTKQLLPYVQRALGEIKPQGGVVSDAQIHEAIARAFEELDDALVKTAKDTIDSDLPYPEKIRRLQPAYAGACALLTLYDPNTGSLHVASTGDCRAVLGRKAAGGKWEATALTKDQTGADEDEIARIKALFPDEPNVCQKGRVWGMQPSRTFGDGSWKWDKDLRQRLRTEYNACKLPSDTWYKDYKTGPYLTASPVVTTTKIPHDGSPAFLVLATDGLWDMMGNQNAVDLVSRWSEMQRTPKQTEQQSPAPSPSSEPVKFGRSGCWYSDSRATVQDSNAAVHLIRNGLGGSHEEMIRGAMSFQSNRSRDIRDDVTVQVVFFGGV